MAEHVEEPSGKKPDGGKINEATKSGSETRMERILVSNEKEGDEQTWMDTGEKCG